MIPTPPASVACLLQTLLHKSLCEVPGSIQSADVATPASALPQPDREVSPGVSRVCVTGGAAQKPLGAAQQRVRPKGDCCPPQPGYTAGAFVRPKRARPLRADQLADKYLAKRLKGLQQNKKKGIHGQPVPAVAATHTGSANVSSVTPGSWALGKQLPQQSRPQHVGMHVQQKAIEPAAARTADAQVVKHSPTHQQSTASRKPAHIAAVCTAAAEQLPAMALTAAHCTSALHQYQHPEQQQQPPAAAHESHAAPAAPAAGDDSDDTWLQLWSSRLLEQDMATAPVTTAGRPAGSTEAAEAAAAEVIVASECADPADAGPIVSTEATAAGLGASVVDATAGCGAVTCSTGPPEQDVLTGQSAVVLSPPPSPGKPDQTCLSQHQILSDAASLPRTVQGTGCQKQEQQKHGQQYRPPQPQQRQQQPVQVGLVQQTQTIAIHADRAVRPHSMEPPMKLSTAVGAHMYNTSSELFSAPAASSLQAAAVSTLPQSQQAAPPTPAQSAAAQAPSIAPWQHQAGSLASACSPAAAAVNSSGRFTLASLLFAMPELPIKQLHAAGSRDTISASVVHKAGCLSPAAPTAEPALVSRAQTRQSTLPAAQALPGLRRNAGHQQWQQQQRTQKQKYNASLQVATAEQDSFGAGAASTAAAAVVCSAAAAAGDGSSSEEGEVAAGSNENCMSVDAGDDIACDAPGNAAAAAAAAAGVKRKRKKSRGGRQVRQRQQRAAADQAAAGQGCVAGSAQGLYAEIKQWEKDNNKGRKNKLAPVDAARDLRFTITEKPPCKFWQMGRCTKGSDCPYPHSGQPASKLIACKFHERGQCKHGDDCRFSHEPVSRQPCPDLVLYHKCVRGDGACQFSHKDLEPEVAEALQRMLLKMQEDDHWQQQLQGMQTQPAPPQPAGAQLQQQALQQQGLLAPQQHCAPWQQHAAQPQLAGLQQHWQPHQQVQQQQRGPQQQSTQSLAGSQLPQHQPLGFVQHPQRLQTFVPGVVGQHLVHHSLQQAYHQQQQQQQELGQSSTGQTMRPR